MFGQKTVFEKTIDSAKVLYKAKQHQKAITLLENSLKKHPFSNVENHDIYIELFKNSFWINKTDSKKYLYESKKNYSDLPDFEKANLDYCLGNIHRLLETHKDSAIYYFLSALKFLEKDDFSSIQLKSKVYQKIASSYAQLNKQGKNYYYLKKNTPNLAYLNDTANLVYNYNNLGTYFSAVNQIDSALFYYKKAFSIKPISKISGSILQNIGGIYLGQLKEIDSAEKYFNQALKHNMSTQGLTSLYFNKGVISSINNNHDLSIKYYQKAKQYADASNNLKMQSYIFEDLSNLYKKNNNYIKALEYSKKHEILKDSINSLELLKKVEEYNIKYETEKKERENLELKISVEKEQQQKKTYLTIAALLLLFGGITAFLIQKNTRKKQKLAEQEKALETQKLATVLKEQELLSIDAMIEGQEKERQRIANDLHDDLGGLMATVKLHFNALKDKQTPELYAKTNTLIDEAYNKVRSVAHAKNSGVIAKQGLLKAITEMADKISALNKITIDIIDHGLENRLENSLELTIFRIVQELITNIIKHANATEATIHITNHDESLNIMVEDNGKGFNPSQITKTKKGMGISSIDKRVEHLNGNMTIESELNKGTTIIIDIPL
ncbi:tetratricopeptide repeat-containing sensor histidine kinase [Gelatiniphilus marinus]|uniref:Oxygen sensor histidine kinase NreB n=1 Tax=Gelatiniphilus marinus TaxID=1759464 RepID=A0ABW5JQV1_9FLAO